MHSGFVDSQGVKLHYLSNQIDDKKISLLFVPGIMMPAWIWNNQLEYFAKYYNVVAMEPRSQGGSDQSSDGHYAYALAKDIQAVVNALHLQPLVLVGWSIGVPQVLNYAQHFASDKLIGLVLVDGIVGIDPGISFYSSMVEHWSQFQMDRIAQTQTFVKCIFEQPLPAAFLEKLTEVALRTPTNTVMTLINNYILQDFRPLLEQVKIPTLIATTEGPRFNYMQMMNSAVPNSQLELFEAAGHALFVDQPLKFNQLLDKFIKTLKRN